MKRVKIAAVAVMIIASALCLNAQQRGGQKTTSTEKAKSRVEKLAETLGLDEDQTAKFIAAQEDKSAATKKLNETTKEKVKAIKEAATKDKEKLAERSDAAIAKILTAEQLEKLEGIKAKAKAKAKSKKNSKGMQRGGQRGGKMMMMQRGGQRGGKMMMQRGGGSNMMQMQMMMRMMSMYNNGGKMQGGRAQGMQGKRPQGMQGGRPQGMQGKGAKGEKTEKDGDATKATPKKGERPQRGEKKTENTAE